ncbi:hypothetical protein [Bacillus thuringiensis]
MKNKVLKLVLVIAAAATFTFIPATKQEKVKELETPILYMDPNPGGG